MVATYYTFLAERVSTSYIALVETDIALVRTEFKGVGAFHIVKPGFHPEGLKPFVPLGYSTLPFKEMCAILLASDDKEIAVAATPYTIGLPIQYDLKPGLHRIDEAELHTGICALHAGEDESLEELKQIAKTYQLWTVLIQRGPSPEDYVQIQKKRIVRPFPGEAFTLLNKYLNAHVVLARPDRCGEMCAEQEVLALVGRNDFPK